MKKASDVPAALKGKEHVIFGNLEDICHFHRNIFLKELEKYETMPEDVGHCFVTWVRKTSINNCSFLKTQFQASKFDIYVYYCTNKPKSTQLLVDHGSPLFENLQKAAGVDQPLAAYLIKPVQRFALNNNTAFSDEYLIFFLQDYQISAPSQGPFVLLHGQRGWRNQRRFRRVSLCTKKGMI